MLRKLGLTALALVVLVLGFFGWGAWQSPPSAGRALAEKSNIPYPAVVAHRGASALAPEETAPAYQLALAMGVDYLELDLQRTKDGILIALHDDTLARTTNIDDVFPERSTATPDQLSFAELQRLDAGIWFNRKFPERSRRSFVGLKILTLDQVIDIAEQGRPIPGLYIETKAASRFPGIEKQLVDRLGQRGWLPNAAGVFPKGRLIFQSFEAASLERLQALAPAVPRAYLISQEMEKSLGWDALLARAKQLGSAIGPVGYLALPWHTGPAHRAGLIVHPYTLNAPWQMRLARQFGADGIFTDASHLALPLLKGREPIDVEALMVKVGY